MVIYDVCQLLSTPYVSDFLFMFNVLHSSTNLNELAKAVHILATVSHTEFEGNDLLKTAKAVVATTAALLNATAPQNIGASFVIRKVNSTSKPHELYVTIHLESAAAVGNGS